MPSPSNALPIVVLLSGQGSNLQAIIDAAAQQALPIEIKAVISNRADAYGLVRAEQAGIATAVLDHKRFANRQQYDHTLRELIDDYQPGLVVLAGFMRILSDQFVEHYLGRMINIHPSLLPKHKGLHTHQRAIEAGDKEHGASVHFVTPALDSGPIILQESTEILGNDTAESLAERVHAIEHRIYPEAIRRFACGEIHFSANPEKA